MSIFYTWQEHQRNISKNKSLMVLLVLYFLILGHAAAQEEKLIDCTSTKPYRGPDSRCLSIEDICPKNQANKSQEISQKDLLAFMAQSNMSHYMIKEKLVNIEKQSIDELKKMLQQLKINLVGLLSFVIISYISTILCVLGYIFWLKRKPRKDLLLNNNPEIRNQTDLLLNNYSQIPNQTDIHQEILGKIAELQNLSTIMIKIQDDIKTLPQLKDDLKKMLEDKFKEMQHSIPELQDKAEHITTDFKDAVTEQSSEVNIEDGDKQS